VIDSIKSVINWLAAPAISVTLSMIGLVAAMFYRPLWTKKGGAMMGITFVAVFLFSFTDANFRIVASTPDNVPILGMLVLVGFFFWYAMYQAQINDDRITKGLPPMEKADSDKKVFTWPDLVYVELIALIICSIIMIVWSIVLKAPLEEPANPGAAPNPAKAPWYFLGLQELLVYFDPWMAGVVLPSLIVVGLMAIPYIDTNPRGNGYYSFRERKFEILLFCFGFIILWVVLIILGTFMRGPNWNFFGPYEYWDPNKLVPLNNVSVSEIFWVKWLHTALPTFWLTREIPGILLIGGYMVALPFALSKTLFAKFYEKMGPMRFFVGVNLFLIMLAVPIKMYLRWTLNLKYILSIQEFSFNI
jgi:Cytochrome b(C-terminal)/b6/petD